MNIFDEYCKKNGINVSVITENTLAPSFEIKFDNGIIIREKITHISFLSDNEIITLLNNIINKHKALLRKDKLLKIKEKLNKWTN
jgi:replication-associated recombination protein RarA